MPYRLRSGLSFCEVDGTVILLDVPADRYFALSPPSSAAFLAYVRHPREKPGPALEQMIEHGVLEPNDTKIGIAACSAKTAAGTMLTGSSPKAPVVDIVEALGRRLIAEAALKSVGFARQVEAVRRRDLPGSADAAIAARASEAFAAAALWRARTRRCLSISFATLSWLAHRGCSAELIFGVRLHPFQAHCWVQHEGRLINDPVDAVRSFTPILAL